MEIINNCQKAYRLLRDTPVYRHSMSYAEEHAEMSQYHLSVWLSIACRDAMDDAIKRYREEYPGEDFSPKIILDKVLRDFSVERVKNILCNRIRCENAFKQEDMEWASKEVIATTQDEGKLNKDFLLDGDHIPEIRPIVDLFRERYDTKRAVEKYKTADDELKEFFNTSDWLYAILQLKNDKSTKDLRFCSLHTLHEMGVTPDINNYEVVYKDEQSYLYGKSLLKMSKPDMLDFLFEVFNLHHPDDFYGHSLSVSDVVAMKRNRKIYYY